MESTANSVSVRILPKSSTGYSITCVCPKGYLNPQGVKLSPLIRAYISKSGKQTPWLGYFWSGCAGQVKRGLEITGIGLVDIDQHDCIMLKAVQSPDILSLENRGGYPQ